MDKSDTLSTFLDDNIIPLLSVTGDEKDPNWQDTQPHEQSNYLRERHWIKQANPTNRWNTHKPMSYVGNTELRLSDLGRKLDDPGDAFYELFLYSRRHIIHVRTWYEVTEVFLPEQAKMVTRFIREYNGLRGQEHFDQDEFLKNLNLGIPDADLQCQMVDKVIDAIEKKAKKGCDGNSYKSLVRDYGRGQLIVGLPLWFATSPLNLTDPSLVLTDFYTRMHFALNEIKHSTLLQNWCPFDSVVIVWNPNLKTFEEWFQFADIGLFTDPANRSLKQPFSALLIGYYLLNKYNLFKPSSIHNSVRWYKYSSHKAMLRDQRRWMRFPGNSRPLGPKACLNIHKFKLKEVIVLSHTVFFFWRLLLRAYVRIHGWRGLGHHIISRFSLRRLYSALRRTSKMKTLYHSSRSKNNNNDRAD